jgi:hypothetical protein
MFLSNLTQALRSYSAIFYLPIWKGKTGGKRIRYALLANYRPHPSDW